MLHGGSHAGVVIGCLVACSSAFADAASGPQPTWIPNGRVEAIAISGSTAYVGGNFSRIAPYTGGSVRLDATTAEADTPWPEVHGNPLPADGSGRPRAAVYAVESDGAGGWYLGGEFASVGGVARQNLAHVLADGTLDPAWAPTTDGVVRALAVSASTVFAGGEFAVAGGQPRNNLAAFSRSSGALLAFSSGVTTANLNVLNGVHDLDLAPAGPTPTELYVAGKFDTATHPSGTTARGLMAAFDIGTGNLTAFHPNVQPTACACAVFSMLRSGARIYIGGSFSSVGGAPRNNLGAINTTTGAADAGWVPGRPGGSNYVRALALSGNLLYVGGNDNGGGFGSKALEAYSTIDATIPSSFNAPIKVVVTPKAIVNRLALVGSTLYAGGTFVSADATPARENLAAYSATTGATTAWAPEGAGPVHALGAAGGDDVVAGGVFETYGGVARRNLAAIDLDTGRPTAFDPPMDGQFASFASVHAIALTDGAVWAGGEFVTESPEALQFLAVFDPATGALASFRRQPNAGVATLAADGNTVYAGGTFSTIGSSNRRGAAALTHVPGEQGTVGQFDPDVAGRVDAILPTPAGVYLGGAFSQLNDGFAARNNLALVSPFDGDALPFDPDVGGRVRALALDGGTLFAGGDFTTVNGSVARQRLAALDALTGAARTWTADTDKPVHTLALHGRTLFAGGEFTTVGATPRAGLAALAADSAALDGWSMSLLADPNSGISLVVYAKPATFALHAGVATGLLAGGDFLLDSSVPRLIHYAPFLLAPVAPSGATATAGDGQATVAFTAPPAPRGAPVTGYTVTAAPGGQTATGAASPLTVAGLTNGTPHTFTVTATNAVGTGPPSAPSNAVTPAGPGGPGGGQGSSDTTAPSLLAFSASPRRFAVGRKAMRPNGTAVAAAKARRGTTLRLELSEAAVVRFTVLRVRSGRRVGKRCRPVTAKNAKRKRCTRLVRRGAFTRSAPAGRSKIAWSGRLRKKALVPGRYRVRAIPTDAAANRGAGRAIAVRIVRR